ncbi:disintegrin and metalloproteinase domain-containing protein 15 isoform X7 [Suricata suricatta]|uniref:disintegrin and metalloproteinase domain-containing protein 15 isoform X7 n=2 Tax=Suricata suricatta TaxID=37032 RepID=UPI0011557538|nr:disintegrin and metalloproteinase domain-containing protein 15 isoform X7 [Suricata suricatta]XP_029791910.1 disintegrin and metalloproteinase domain-containing protein 15 isoform X7 [Suricata suricatta]XP_029791911.1 disintegrin and metalloproteinase domain-containing protein 15 isoform X7 [Suricata suricatta]
MRLALLWALGLLGAGSPLSSRPLPDVGDPAGGTAEGQARPERDLGGPSEPQILRDSPTLSLAEMVQTSLPEALRISLELDGESHILELLRTRGPGPGRPSLTWYQPDGTRVVSEKRTPESCCYQGVVQGRAGSWVSVCTCSGLRGLVILSPERSYTFELGPGDLRATPVISRTQDLLLPGRTCALRGRASVPTQAPPERHQGQRHSCAHGRRRRRDVVAETKVIELVLVADHSEVQRYPDSQHLLSRMLEVAFLLDAFFRPLNVRVALVGLEAWSQHDLAEISRDPGLTLHNFLRWRRRDLLPRLPHDSAQLVTATSFSGPAVGMAVQDSICSPDLSGGVNMDHSGSVLGVASSIAHELGHSLGLDHDLPGSSCPCPGPAPAKSCIMEASTDFLPGLNFSNCSRRALEQALLGGLGGCLFERLSGLPSMAAVCGNTLVEPGEQCDCGFPDECTDPCCDYFTCRLRPGARCASGGLCCQNCQLRPAGWQCRPARGDCDLAELCSGDSPQCPPDISLGDGEPCAGGQAVCMQGRCASYARQCQALWGPEAQPATPLCVLTANTRGDAFGSCGRSPDGGYLPCAPKDAVCGQLQCQGGWAQPLLGSARDLYWETVEANGTGLMLNCSRVHLDLGNDVAQPLLTLPGTACGPDLVCIDHQCQPVGLLGAQECRSKCHEHGVCDSKGHCRCEEGWAPPDCANPIRAASALTTGLPLSLLLLAALTLLGISYWHRGRLRQRLCQLKGPSCQYRAAQCGPPEHPGPPQRALPTPGAKVSPGYRRREAPPCAQQQSRAQRGQGSHLEGLLSSEPAKQVAVRGQCSWLPGTPLQAAAS